MDKKSKIFFIIFLLLIIGSVAVTYYRIMIEKDYIISAEVDCDPYLEECFIWECDPEATDEWESCTGDPEEDIWYYKIIERKAANIPLCDPNDEECEALTCPEGEDECEEILCTEEDALEGEVCNDPKEYALENPLEDEEIEEIEADEESNIEELETDNAESMEDIEESGELESGDNASAEAVNELPVE